MAASMLHCTQHLTAQNTSLPRSLTSTPAGCSFVREVKASKSSVRYGPRVTTCQLGVDHRSEALHAEANLARRDLLGLAAAAAFSAASWDLPQSAQASPGGLPGLADPDSNGIAKYTRPAGKSGNHGIGWAAIDSYSFKVPEGWEQVGSFEGEGYGGQEIDLRFENKNGGKLTVIVAPAGRFVNIEEGDRDRDITLTTIGGPEKVIGAFAAEITNGGIVEKEDIVSVENVTGKGGRPYYVYELKGHTLVSATAIHDRVYILSIRSSSSQWRKSKDSNYAIRDSFVV